MDKLIEVSISGGASVENNKVVVDYSELKKLTTNYYQLLEALKNTLKTDSFQNISWVEIAEAIKQAEAE